MRPEPISVWRAVALAVVALAGLSPAKAGEQGWPRAPRFKVMEVLTNGASDTEARGAYHAFPALLPLGGARVLVTYKAGRGHTWDPGAPVATLELDLVTGDRWEQQRFTPPSPLLFQCAEPVRFADGTAALFIDTQRIGPEPRHYRAPMRWARSLDGGRRYGDPAVFPVIGGVRYGYPFEGVTVGDVTYLLVMTFGYLEGGRWSVDVLATEDSGHTWRRLRNLSDELRVPGFNEGTLLPTENGFIIASRSYDRQARLHEVGRDFQLRRQVNLTTESPWVSSYIGRPRLLRHGDEVYLLGRNWTRAEAVAEESSAENPLGFPREQQLCLFRIDRKTLRPASCWILDNAEQAPVSDGYYAVAASTGDSNDARLHVITYKGVRGAPPRLVRLEFKWSELAE